MNRLLFLFLPFLLASCASIINNDLQKINVRPDPGIRVLEVDSIPSLSDLQDSTAYHVFRKKGVLRIIAETDSLRDTIRVKSRLSPVYALNLWSPALLGFVIDLYSPRRFAYAREIRIARTSDGLGLALFRPARKDALHLEFGWQLYNHFYLPVFNGNDQIQGVLLGFSGGLQYCYHEKRGVLLAAGAATAGNFYAPVERFNNDAEFDFGNAFFVSLRHQHVIGSFELGCGADFLQTRVRRVSGYGKDEFYLYSPKSYGFGPELALHYRLGPNLRLGAVYRTVFWESRYGKKMSPGYDHAIAVELNFDGAVYRFRKK